MYTNVLNTAQFELIFTVENQRVENVFHVNRASTSWDSSTLTTMCATFVTWYSASLKSLVTSSASLVLILATDLTTKSSPRVEYTTSLPIAGTNAGTLLPANVTAAISWRTAKRGRSYRGRSFHIGMTSTMVTGSTLTAGTITSLTTAYNALLTAVNASGIALCVVSRFQNHVQLTNGESTPITVATIEGNLDSQRRRLIGRGK